VIVAVIRGPSAMVGVLAVFLSVSPGWGCRPLESITWRPLLSAFDDVQLVEEGFPKASGPFLTTRPAFCSRTKINRGWPGNQWADGGF